MALSAPLYLNDALFAQLPARVDETEGEIVPVYADTIGITYSPSRITNAHAFPSGGAGVVSSANDLRDAVYGRGPR